MGRKVSQVLVDGEQVEWADDQYTLSDVTASHTIKVSFAWKPYRITTSAGPGGDITPSVDVMYGKNQTIKFMPDPGHKVSWVEVDGHKVSWRDNEYEFTNVQRNDQIMVGFEKEKHEITVSIDTEGGSVSPSGTIILEHGSQQTFTVTPHDRYEEEVRVDGAVVMLTNGQHTLNVTGPHKITVNFFALDQDTIAPAVPAVSVGLAAVQKQPEQRLSWIERPYLLVVAIYLILYAWIVERRRESFGNILSRILKGTLPAEGEYILAVSPSQAEAPKRPSTTMELLGRLSDGYIGDTTNVNLLDKMIRRINEDDKSNPELNGSLEEKYRARITEFKQSARF